MVDSSTSRSVLETRMTPKRNVRLTEGRYETNVRSREYLNETRKYFFTAIAKRFRYLLSRPTPWYRSHGVSTQNSERSRGAVWEMILTFDTPSMLREQAFVNSCRKSNVRERGQHEV